MDSFYKERELVNEKEKKEKEKENLKLEAK
jgi:hypothetical protein